MAPHVWFHGATSSALSTEALGPNLYGRTSELGANHVHTTESLFAGIIAIATPSHLAIASSQSVQPRCVAPAHLHRGRAGPTAGNTGNRPAWRSAPIPGTARRPKRHATQFRQFHGPLTVQGHCRFKPIETRARGPQKNSRGLPPSQTEPLRAAYRTASAASSFTRKHQRSIIEVLDRKFVSRRSGSGLLHAGETGRSAGPDNWPCV